MGNQCRRAVQADRPAFTGIDLLALFIGVSTLLAGVIGIGNIMWVIVKERTYGKSAYAEAIGAKPRDIIVQNY